MPVPTVHFKSAADGVPFPLRDGFQKTLRLAIETCRPADEEWTVVISSGSHDSLITIDFSRGTDGPRSLTFQPDGDDSEHSALFKTACQFLRMYWEGKVAPS